jgi:hypothetical protein
VLSFFASLPNDLFELPEGTPVPPARMAAE